MMRRLSLLSLLFLLAAFVQPASAAETTPKAESLKITIKVIPGLIKFDTTRFDVNAGARVKLTFSNDCVLPHNLVFLKPETEPALLAAVNAMGLEGAEKHFVPEVAGIIASTRLLQPATETVISFDAPDQEGEYPYVCTYPGHWFTMRGIMRVRANGTKLEGSVKSAEKIPQVEDALKKSGMSHKPVGTKSKAFVMRTFAPDPGLDPAVFAHHGVGKDAVKYDPSTRMDITEKITDPATGITKEVPIQIKSLKGIAGAIAVNQGADFSYIWDSTECRLLYVWRNGFLDMNPYWGKEPGAGRPKVYIPLIIGNLVYRASGPMPLAKDSDPAPVFLGYKMENGAPEFRYRLGGKTFREKVLPSGKEDFELRVTPEEPSMPVEWKIPRADTEVTRTSTTDKSELVIHITDRPEPQQLPPSQTGEKQKQ